MDDPVPARLVERVADGDPDREGFLLGQGALVLDALPEIDSFDELHGDEVEASREAGIERANEVLVVELRRRARLAEEALAVLVILRDDGVHDLERDRLA